MNSKTVYILTFLLLITDSLAAQIKDTKTETKVSHLEMPNAFSPNGDGINDVYGAKSGYENITSFRATIFSRRGERLYQWNSIDGCWDGTRHGHPVADGVYYVRVEAEGADGQHYSIKKAITLLRSFDDTISR